MKGSGFNLSKRVTFAQQTLENDGAHLCPAEESSSFHLGTR